MHYAETANTSKISAKGVTRFVVSTSVATTTFMIVANRAFPTSTLTKAQVLVAGVVVGQIAGRHVWKHAEPIYDDAVAYLARLG